MQENIGHNLPQNNINNNQQANMQQPAQTQNSGSSDKKTNPKMIVGIIVLVLVVLGGVGFTFMQGKETTSIEEPSTAEQEVVTDGAQGTGDLEDVQEVDSGTSKLGDMAEEAKEELPPATEEMMAPAVKDATLSINSDKKVYSVGDQITAKVILNANKQPDGVEFIINFDSAKLTNVSMTKGTVFSTYLKNEVDQEKGAAKVMVIVNPNEEIDISAPIEMVTITGTVAQAGVLELGFDMERTLVAADWGKDILEAANNLQVQVN